MERKPFLSFVIPAYNVSQYIERTLNSILNQTEHDMEIIVVNDGSTDNTLDVAKTFLEKSGFSNYLIVNKKNGGVSSARNVGMRMAKGEYLLFLDGDDYIAPELVEKVKSQARIKNLDMVCWKFDMVDENGLGMENLFPQSGLEGGKPYDGPFILEKILVDRNFWLWIGCIAFKNEKLRTLGLNFSERIRFGEDLQFIFKFLLNSETVLLLPDHLSFYVQRQTSVSSEAKILWFDSFESLIQVMEYLESLSSKVLKHEAKEILRAALLENALLMLMGHIVRNIEKSGTPASALSLLKYLKERFGEKLNKALNTARRLRKITVKMDPQTKLRYRLFLFSPELFILGKVLHTILKKLVRLVVNEN